MAKYTINGLIFNSYEEVAKHFQIPILVLKTRVQRWGSIQKAALTPYKAAPIENVTVNGILFENITKACEFFGISRDIIYKRVRKDKMTVEEAINLGKGGKYHINGVYFDSIKQLCSHFNISRYTIETRVAKGMTIEQAINYVEPTTQHGIILGGTRYNTLEEVSMAYRIPIDTLRHKLRSGMRLNEAVKRE